MAIDIFFRSLDKYLGDQSRELNSQAAAELLKAANNMMTNSDKVDQSLNAAQTIRERASNVNNFANELHDLRSKIEWNFQKLGIKSPGKQVLEETLQQTPQKRIPRKPVTHREPLPYEDAYRVSLGNPGHFAHLAREILGENVDSLGLRTSIRNTLIRNSLVTVGSVLGTSYEQLFHLRIFGDVSWRNLVTSLHNKGIEPQIPQAIVVQTSAPSK